MRISFFGIALLCAAPLLAGAAAWYSATKAAAGQGTAAVPLQYPTSELRRTILRRAAAESLEESTRRAWNLSEKEWSRYQELMHGPRGHWSPLLDPIATLGIHAATDAERRRLAERFVDMENRRIQEELAFQRAVNAAVQARYSELPLLVPDKPVVQNEERLLLFAPLSCLAHCRPLLDTARRALQRGSAGLDIYLSGAPDDTAMREWARTLGISRQTMRTHQITLNRDATPAGGPPRLMVQRGDELLAFRP